jgi:hypothetical protein
MTDRLRILMVQISNKLPAESSLRNLYPIYCSHVLARRICLSYFLEKAQVPYSQGCTLHLLCTAFRAIPVRFLGKYEQLRRASDQKTISLVCWLGEMLLKAKQQRKGKLTFQCPPDVDPRARSKTGNTSVPRKGFVVTGSIFAYKSYKRLKSDENERTAPCARGADG